ncbi:MAG: class I SAM-dependent methyltransferase [Bacteroidota bacterium]
MVRTINGKSDSLSAVAEFYDGLAPQYDEMAGSAARTIREKPFFRLLVERHGIRTAIDAGAGTGFHAFLLAQLGVSVTAVDISAAMVDQLRENSRENGLRIETLVSGFQELGDRFRGEVDAVFCMGNSLAHLLEPGALDAGLESFGRVVKPGGILFLQLVNFRRILAARERVQSVRETPDHTFVRSYDYREGRIDFHIEIIEKGERAGARTKMTVTLRPISWEELDSALQKAGFSGAKPFGAISMEDYRPDSSQDLVVRAWKKESPKGPEQG